MSEDIMRPLTYYVRLTKPDTVITWNPERNFALYNYYFEHYDHQTTGAILLRTAYPTARDPKYYPEQILVDGLSTFKIRSVYMFSWQKDINSGNKNDHIVVPLSLEDMQLKVKALMEHKSQVGEQTPTFLYDMGHKLGQASKTVYAEWFKRVLLPA
jgi:LmbE family N-acetylglucosaminyl deacetylase